MRHKPHPEPFEEVIEMAGLDPKTTIVLGDSRNDIIAAKAAGIRSCLFLPEENKPFYDFDELKKTKPDYIVTTLKDFMGLVAEV